MLIPRNLAGPLRALAHWHPVAVVTGPRQSGKTTLCRATSPEKAYVSLEPLDQRDFAASDPRGFLRLLPNGAIIDEVQRSPELPSYLQEEVDRRPEPGRFVLTGSQHFGLSDATSQSLAGRAGVLALLPLSLDEVRRFEDPPSDLPSDLWSGGFPRIFDRKIPPDRWLADYVSTYVERDVRRVLNVGDPQAFTTFVRLCAGRTAQELNLSAIGADAGVSHTTARAWLSVLETSNLCFRIPAWHRSLGKRPRKAAKLHFVDSGLVCTLLGIRSPDHLVHHPLRGAEVDVIVDASDGLILVEAKSGATVPRDALGALGQVAARLEDLADAGRIRGRLVYGGDTSQPRGAGDVVAWSDIHERSWL